MQDIIKPMLSVMDLVKLKLTNKNCLMMSLNESNCVRNTFRLKYTNFILTNKKL